VSEPPGSTFCPLTHHFPSVLLAARTNRSMKVNLRQRFEKQAQLFSIHFALLRPFCLYISDTCRRFARTKGSVTCIAKPLGTHSESLTSVALQISYCESWVCNRMLRIWATFRNKGRVEPFSLRVCFRRSTTCPFTTQYKATQ